MRNKTLECCVGLGLVGLTLSVPALGQTITGSISGTVTDQAGSVIPNASVTATNLATGVTTAATTNGSGTYSIRFLQIGQYKVSVKQPGFSESTYGPFNLEIDQTAKIDAKLNVGSDTTSVQVTNSAAPILNTDNATIATTFTANTIENIPLNGRNFTSLMLFLPGAVTTQPSGFTGQNAIERSQDSSSQASVNGNRQQTNNFRLDGVEINETINNLVGYNPSPDALGEVKVISANAQAEYGNVNGGDVVAVLKSGSSQFHGSIFGFLENYNLDANSWGNKNQQAVIDPVTGRLKANPIAKSSYTQTIFGGTVGGPVIKDKLFFFADYEGSRYHSGGVSTATVATAKMRTGDFSEYLDPVIMAKKPVQLYDASNGFKPYVNNQGIPINSPAAQYLFAHPEIYPLPNAAPTVGSPITNNYRGSSSTRRFNNQGDVKIDWTPYMADRVSVRYSQGEAGDTTVNPLAISFPGANSYPFKGTAINWVHSFNPTLVNLFQGGFSRIRWTQGLPSDTTGVFGQNGNQLLGIPGGQPYAGFSALNITGGGNIGNLGGGTNFIDNIFSYSDDLTWQRGKHLLKGGVQFVRYQQNNFYPGNDGAQGQFNYNGNYTSNPIVGTVGNGFADFVLDRSSFVGIGGVTGRTGQRQWRSAYYGQDDYKIMPNLTLNLGVRYEFDQPIYEVNNKQANVDLATGVAYTAGEAGTSGIFGNGQALYHAYYGNLQPRIGFSYQPSTKTVIRGGFGITNTLEGTGANLRLTFNPPFQSSFEVQGTAPSTTSPGTSFQLANGFTSANNPNFGGTTYRAWDSHIKPSSINEFSLTTEYAINNTTSLTIGYVGETGRHLIQAVALNQLHSPCVINGVVSDPNSAACAASNPAPYQALVTQSGAVVGTATEAMMNYNALQVSYRQRATHGLEYTLNYAYGRSMTNSVGFFGVPSINGASPYAENAYNNTAEYGPAGQDIRNNVNGTMVYELPVGRGKQFLGNTNHLLDEAIGGWKLSATGIAYSGVPVTPNDSSINAFTNSKAQRPNYVRPLHVVNRSVNNWYGTDTASTTPCAQGAANLNATCAFQQPLDGTYGTASVGSLRGPGFQQYDFSGFKDFAVFREYKLGFRVDAFNALNQSSYGNPDNTVQDTTFGQITSVRSVPRQIQFSGNFKF